MRLPCGRKWVGSTKHIVRSIHHYFSFDSCMRSRIKELETSASNMTCPGIAALFAARERHRTRCKLKRCDTRRVADSRERSGACRCAQEGYGESKIRKTGTRYMYSGSQMYGSARVHSHPSWTSQTHRAGHVAGQSDQRSVPAQSPTEREASVRAGSGCGGLLRVSSPPQPTPCRRQATAPRRCTRLRFGV